MTNDEQFSNLTFPCRREKFYLALFLGDYCDFVIKHEYISFCDFSTELDIKNNNLSIDL